MGSLNELRGGSFNQLLNVIKGMSRRSDSTLLGHQNVKILSNLRELVPSISFLMKEHPQHISVILYHLSSVTSRLKVSVGQECVTETIGKYDFRNNNSCKICNGLCKEVYFNFLDIIEENLGSLGPKGLSHIFSVYSSCKDQKIHKILNEIQLRMCYFIYCGCKIRENLFNNSVYYDIDSILSKYSDLINKYPASSLQEGDYLIDFIKLSSNNEYDSIILVNKSKYYLPVNLMDICTTLDSLTSMNLNKDSNTNLLKNYEKIVLLENSKEFLDDYSKEFNEFKDFKYLLLDLSFRFLLFNSFKTDIPKLEVKDLVSDFRLDLENNTTINITGSTNTNNISNRDSNSSTTNKISTTTDSSNKEIKFVNLFEIDTVCRLINIFKQFRYQNELLSPMIVEIINSSADELDFRNLASLLDALSYYNSRASRLDYPYLISRINYLSSRDELDSLRSMSTSIYVMSILKETKENLDDYNQFLKISKQALERYVMKWRQLLKNQKSLRAITIILKSIGDQDIVNIVCECILDDLFLMNKKALFDYNMILDLLIKYYKNNINIDYSNDIIDVDDYINTSSSDSIYTYDSTSNRDSNSSSTDKTSTTTQSISSNSIDSIENINQSDLCKIASTICLIICKCSPYYCNIVSEHFNNNKEKENKENKENEEKGKLNQPNGWEIRELCYFLNNITNFYNLNMIDNQYQNDYTEQIRILFSKVESFFIKYHSNLSEINHQQISNFLSEVFKL